MCIVNFLQCVLYGLNGIMTYSQVFDPVLTRLGDSSEQNGLFCEGFSWIPGVKSRTCLGATRSSCGDTKSKSSSTHVVSNLTISPSQLMGMCGAVNKGVGMVIIGSRVKGPPTPTCCALE